MGDVQMHMQGVCLDAVWLSSLTIGMLLDEGCCRWRRL